MKWLIVGLCTIAAMCFLMSIPIMWVFSVYNTEVDLRNRYTAQYKIRETTMDNMIKTLRNQNKVITESYAKNFIAAVVAQSEGRKGGSGGNLVSAKFVRESEKLGIPTEMFAQLTNSIAGKLSEYKRSQDTLVDIWREHQTFCSKFPYKWFVGDKLSLCPEPVMITSDTVQESVKSGKLSNDILNL